MINQANFENKFYDSSNQDTFSPVPVIWLTRLISRDFIMSGIAKMEFSYDNFIKSCGEEFSELIIPPGILNNDFNYQISK